MQNKLQLLDASVRHLGTDINYVVLENIYAELKDKVDFRFCCEVERLEITLSQALASIPVAYLMGAVNAGETAVFYLRGLISSAVKLRRPCRTSAAGLVSGAQGEEGVQTAYEDQ